MSKVTPPLLLIKQLVDKVRRLRRTVYSLRTSKRFKSCGKGCYFSKFSQLLGTDFIDVGGRNSFGPSCFLTAWDINNKEPPHIQIGNECSFGAQNHITCSNEIIIGNEVLTGKWVTITDNSHGETDKESLCVAPNKRTIISKGPVIIHNKVWIGDKVTILPGVTIGEGAVIAANAVVTKDIPPYSVVAGVPAKIVKKNE